MEIGDMVKVRECKTAEGENWTPPIAACACFFCTTGSNRIGVVITVAPRNAYHVMFDTGMWRLDMFDEAKGDVEVIRAAR